jgi:hypothetical protein
MICKTATNHGQCNYITTAPTTVHANLTTAPTMVHGTLCARYQLSFMALSMHNTSYDPLQSMDGTNDGPWHSARYQLWSISLCTVPAMTNYTLDGTNHGPLQSMDVTNHGSWHYLCTLPAMTHYIIYARYQLWPITLYGRHHPWSMTLFTVPTMVHSTLSTIQTMAHYIIYGWHQLWYMTLPVHETNYGSRHFMHGTSYDPLQSMDGTNHGPWHFLWTAPTMVHSPAFLISIGHTTAIYIVVTIRNMRTYLVAHLLDTQLPSTLLSLSATWGRTW